MPTAEILSQGDEVVTGQIADTNAAWLATQLTELGFTVTRHTTVGDRLGDLVAVLGDIAARCDLCIGTGGLGPTDDDLTAQAVAEAFDLPLQLDAQALEQIQARYAAHGREMPEVNRKQALLPTGSERLDNEWGTAPGFAVEAGSAWLAFVPGVPREMRAMWSERLLPRIRERFEVAPGRLVTLRTVGIGESNLQQAIGPFSHDDVVLSYRTRLPENHLKLRFAPGTSDARVRHVVTGLVEVVGRWLFTVEGLPGEALPGIDCAGGSHAEVVGRALLARGHTLATAESCTGGRIGAVLTGIPGASTWFLEGVISYSNAAKVRLLGVSEAVLAEHGAVSEPVARQMAEGVRTRAGTTWGIGVTGIAGPGGGTPDKPVGTVHVAVAGPDAVHHRALRLPGDRDRVQQLSVAAALELLRRNLLTTADGS
jgi:nicotinamide-nucleotide amidase